MVNNSLDEWDLDTFQKTGSWPGAPGEYYNVSDDGKWRLKSEHTGSFTLANTATGQTTNRQLDISVAIDHVFSRDGRRFAAASWLGYAGVWETESFRLVATVGSRRLPMSAVGFSADGSRLLTGDHGTGRIRLWDLRTQRELIAFPGSGYGQFSPDGNLLVCRESRSLHIYRAPLLAEIDAAEKTDTAARK
jgi:WD40 repeat protein